jgi:hypothetical protein
LLRTDMTNLHDAQRCRRRNPEHRPWRERVLRQGV